jgi:hypothetical protein
MAANNPLPIGYFVTRFLFSLGFVFATYNPTGYSFYHWIIDFTTGPLPVKAVVAVALVMLYYAIFRVVFAALHRSGLIVGGLAAVLFAIEVVALIGPRRSHPTWHFYFLLSQYIALLAIAVVVSFGISWSHLIELLTGQLQKRYVRR